MYHAGPKASKYDYRYFEQKFAEKEIEPAKVKQQIKWCFCGRKSDSFDFFPTTESSMQDNVEPHIDIREWTSVLRPSDIYQSFQRTTLKEAVG